MAKRKQTFGEGLIEALQEVVAHRRGEIELPTRVVPDTVDVVKIRKGLRLSQARFADRFGFDVKALQEWEQGRRQPERSARVLLKVIEKHPEAVDDALKAA
jgi:putative transcriptional regulator